MISYSNLSQNTAEQVISSIIPWLTIFADQLDFMVLFVCIILQCCFIAIASYNNNNYNLLCSIWGYRYYEVCTIRNVAELNRVLEFLNEDIFRGVITDSLYRSNSKKKDNH